MPLAASLSHLDSWEARCRYVASLYCKLGTLIAVGEVLGVTRERVRQLLAMGHREGWFQYQPSTKRNTCNAVAALPLAIKQARSGKHLSTLCGLDQQTSRKLLVSLGLKSTDLHHSFRKNNAQYHLDRLIEVAQRQGVGDTLDTTVIQSSREGRTAYNSALRNVGGIKEIRRRAGISIVTNDRRWSI